MKRIIFFLLFAVFATASAQVTRVYPDSSATDVAVGDTIFWNITANTIVYDLEVYSDIGLRTLAIEQPALTDTLYVYSGLNAFQNYYWRMRSKDSTTGVWSIFTNVWKFTTSLAAPDTVLLQYPNNLETGIDSSVTLMWHASDLASNYVVQVSKYSSLDSTEVALDTVTTSYASIVLSPSTTYYWRIQAYNSVADSVFSEQRRFTTHSR